jgi:hypothetical protein
MNQNIGDALGRFNKTLQDNEPEGDETPGKPEGGKGHGHVHTVHIHKDGTHHHLVHHGGQLVHHSEHPNMQEATDSMNSYSGEE